MFIDQISVFIENKKGRLSGLTRTLADNGIDLIALSIADTADYGIMRAIVNDAAKAKQVLRDAGYTVNITQVLAVLVPDTPGGLAGVLELFNEADISVEYLYSFVRTQKEQALILFKVDNSQAALDLLREHNIQFLSQEEVNKL